MELQDILTEDQVYDLFVTGYIHCYFSTGFYWDVTCLRVAGERAVIIECLCRRCYNLSTDAGTIVNYGKHTVET